MFRNAYALEPGVIHTKDIIQLKTPSRRLDRGMPEKTLV